MILESTVLYERSRHSCSRTGDDPHCCADSNDKDNIKDAEDKAHIQRCSKDLERNWVVLDKLKQPKFWREVEVDFFPEFGVNCVHSLSDHSRHDQDENEQADYDRKRRSESAPAVAPFELP